jgi:recombinational DNA repair ATPase RecF
MISVESITIKEFRGIRDLTLNFNEKNFAICGPNGTGKSGVVDALEFVLIGNVSRLSGEGMGDVTLKEHGPHVDKRNDPDKARVTVKIRVHSLNKIFTVERNLKTPGTVQITPCDAAVVAVLKQVETHPEIMLSRRELIRYVLATPGKRAEEVRALLHLDDIEKVRFNLQKIANNCKKQVTPLAVNAKESGANFLRALGITELSKDKVLAAVNIQRGLIGLPVLTELTKTTSLKDGMATPAPVSTQRIPKVQAIADIKVSREAIAELSNSATVVRIAEVTAELTVLNDDPAILASVKREALYSTGIELIGAGECPLCDTLWDLQELKTHIQAKITHLKEISKKRKFTENKILPLLTSLRKTQTTITALVNYAAIAVPSVAVESTKEYIKTLKTFVDDLTAFLPLSNAIEVLAKMTEIPQAVEDEIAKFEKVVQALPEPTKQDAAKEWLTVAQERLDALREATQRQKIAQEKADKTQKISDAYSKTSDEVLTGIYQTVEKDFEKLYAFIHSDEDKFEAKLTPSLGKLGFNVDFYGRGFFPPGAYHSEGHQDSMGLCLYLALMKHLQGDAFTFAVLDDVLMSVDAGHRRQVCSLLKKVFPKTQFIMTTHDPIWLRHMKTEKIIEGKNSVQFRSWNVDQGPSQWDERDVWTEIDDCLNKNDVHGAASILRHYLEYISAELCHKLRAGVEFRGDGQYQLGELLPQAIRQMQKLFGTAKAAANSWNQQAIVQQISDQEAEFVALADASKAEQWQTNIAIHYNSWDNLQKEDFEPVVKAFKELLIGFTCPNPLCGEYLHVSPERETPDTVRCECGQINLNLKKK